MKNTRVEISFQSQEVWRVRSSIDDTPIFCPVCPNNAPMILAEKFASAMNVSPREVYQKIERGEIHFIETENREIFVCVTAFRVTRIVGVE